MENVIGFVGYECEDIALYLAKMFLALGKKTAMEDRTEHEMLIEMLGISYQKECSLREGEYGGIHIANYGVQAGEYDVVIRLFGYRLEHPKLYECGILVMVTDGVPAHASYLKNMEQWECRRALLLRNLVWMRHSAKYLSGLADKTEYYGEIPYEERDIRMRCSLNPYSQCKINSLSAGMKRILLELISFISRDYNERTVFKTMKKI